MNKYELANNLNSIIDNKAKKFVAKFSISNNFKNFIEPYIINLLRRTVFMEIKMLIIIEGIKKLKSSNKHIQCFEKSIQTCEVHINQALEEFYKILFE